jgi:membrane protein
MPYFLIIFAFAFVYLFVPNTRVSIRAAFVGALVGGALWQTTGMAFATFATTSTKYAAIYSGFAILALFMIWLYLSWLILLLGAQVAYYYQYPEQIRLSNLRVPLSGRFREQMGLLVMFRVAERFVHDGKPLTLEALAGQLAMPGDRVVEMLTLLQERGLLIASGNEPTEYLLLHDPGSLSIHAVLNVLRQPDDEQALLENRVHSVDAVDALMQRMELGVKEHLDGMSLRELVIAGEESLRTTPPDDGR